MTIALSVSLRLTGLAALTLVAAGCADKVAAVPPLSPVSTTSARVATHGKTAKDADGAGGDAADKSGEDGVTTQSLHLSETIANACNLPNARSEATPHFGFDSAALAEDERAVLAAFAKCLSGPLKGKSVLLIGRTDGRGEPEYNMGLGGSRSDSVKRYLLDLGVGEAHIEASSRGEIDATGRDEEGWAKDRRVDIDVR
jgi:outer membrane protein OmpA-like peptidoglycan-associated protein